MSVDNDHHRHIRPQHSHVMSTRRVRMILVGLMLALFVSMLSSTILANALPQIVGDLGGSQTGYSWVVVATLLTITATTPIWGKLGDLYNKLLLIQAAIVIYCTGSVVGTFAHDMKVLLLARGIQGIGAGGLSALTLLIIGWVATPSERARFAGYMGAVYALATVLGPLIGGMIVDSPLGWRGCFFASLPVAVLAVALLQVSLRLPRGRPPLRIDYVGSILIIAGVSLLLVWLSMVGHQFDWFSLETGAMLGGGAAVSTLAVIAELRHPEPVLPLHMFRDRTILLVTLAAALLGSAAFASTLYPAQYFQLARGMSPTDAGLMTMSSVGAMGIASVVSGRSISRTGRWRPWLAVGAAAVLLGLVLMGTVGAHTNLILVGVYLAVLGWGLGSTMQNLIITVQNHGDLARLGAVSALAAFCRTLGGAVGVCAMGAALSVETTRHFEDRLSRLHADSTTGPIPAPGQIPVLRQMHSSVRTAYSQAFGTSIGEAFMMITPLAGAALICLLLIRTGAPTANRRPTQNEVGLPRQARAT